MAEEKSFKYVIVGGGVAAVSLCSSRFAFFLIRFVFVSESSLYVHCSLFRFLIPQSLDKLFLIIDFVFVSSRSSFCG